MAALLLLATVFAFAADARSSRLFLVLGALAVLAFFRAPRWLCHVVALIAATFFVAQFVFSTSNLSSDANSVRDDAVEVAAERFIAGINPWNERGPLSTLITSGPASVLLAVPAVLLFGRINELSFALYLAFLAFLFAADARRQNGTFVPLSLFVISGFLGFQHTLRWSLEELYWAYAVLALVPLLVGRNHLPAAGACLAFALCSRASYAFPVFGSLCWWWIGRRPSGTEVARLTAGATAGAIVILAPFLIVGGAQFLAHNPFTTAGNLFSRPATETNLFFVMLNAVSNTLGPVAGGALKILAALAIIGLASLRLASPSASSFFWQLCLGAFVANFLVYRSQLSQDYALFFAVPAFMATALSRGFGVGISQEELASPAANR